jgi:predicted DsbA family dithiol-disulfide isomerase
MMSWASGCFSSSLHLVEALRGDQSIRYFLLLIQGKFINDRAVLLEAAENAGLKDAKSVLDDETVERDRVTRYSHTL